MSFTFPRSAATEAYICHYGSLLRSRSVWAGAGGVALLTAGLARLRAGERAAMARSR